MDRLPRGGYLVAATIELGLVGVHHHRRDDSHGAAIEDHLDVFVLAGGDAGQGDAAGVGDRREHVRGGLDVGVGVLHVDGQPRKPDPRHEPGPAMLPSVSQVPICGFPARNARLTGFSFKSVPRHRRECDSVEEPGGIGIDPPQTRVSHVNARRARHERPPEHAGDGARRPALTARPRRAPYRAVSAFAPGRAASPRPRPDRRDRRDRRARRKSCSRPSPSLRI